MDDVRRKTADHPNAAAAMERLTHAIAFHRATLASPIEDHFVTPEQLRQMPLPPEPAPQWQRAGQSLITRAMCHLGGACQRARADSRGRTVATGGTPHPPAGKAHPECLGTRSLHAVFPADRLRTDRPPHAPGYAASRIRRARGEDSSDPSPPGRGRGRPALRPICPGPVYAHQRDGAPKGSVRFSSIARVQLEVS